MIQKYKKLLLHLDLFLSKMELDRNIITQDKFTVDMIKNRRILEELYQEYPLYLIGDMDSENLFTSAEMLGVLPYVENVFPLQGQYPMGNIMNSLQVSRPEEYLVCGNNLENEIALARRAFMDSCYVGNYNHSFSFVPTYHVEKVEDIKTLLKLR